MNDIESGLHFIIEPLSTSLSQEEADQLAELKPSGVMFRKRNILQGVHYDVWLQAYAELLDAIKNAIGRERIIVCVDHEGGAIQRFPHPITTFPYAAYWGTRTSDVAKAMAQELKSLAVNMSFAPVLDIHSNPDNPVINERAFGTSKEKVCELALQFLEALEEKGILGCGKHFPGHGDTACDSHFELPVIEKEKSDLLAEELVPFKAAIDAGISAIMSAHLRVPAIDTQEVATLSSNCMQRLLREELGFEGVLITDAIGMQAVLGDMRDRNGAVKAINAGVDLLCVAGDPVTLSDSLAMKSEIEQAVASGRIPTDVIEQSQGRVEELLHRLPQYTVTTLAGDVLATHKELADSLKKNKPWGSFEFSASGFE